MHRWRAWWAAGISAWLLGVSVDAATLVPRGAMWRWRPGTNEASVPIPAWRQVGFADVQFTSAPAPFWYGDPLEGGTRITGMQNVYRCLFLRTTFVVTNRGEIGGLRMGALVDDGFVAWINGIEVLRVGMPGAAGGEVTIETLANNASEPVSFASYNLSVPPTVLANGTNVLAVQVFQSALASSDLGFDASLESLVRDVDPPVLRSVLPTPGGVVDRLTEITVTFGEPVDGVVAAHLLVNGIGATSVTAVDESTYRFVFSQPAYGAVSLRWSANQTIVDRAIPPNRFDAGDPGAAWTYQLVDRTPPAVAGLLPAAGATVRTLDSVKVLFDEPVTGVEAEDLLINGVPATGLTSIAGSEHLFRFGVPPTGVVQVAWSAGHGIRDFASPPNPFAGGSWTYRFDPNAADEPPYLSEFMASNSRTLADENGQYSDWIEIFNPSGGSVDLEGWYLTDDAGDPTKWRFPATNIAGRGFMVVFASGNDRRVPGARLHTSFQLGAGGEYLALVRPDGRTIAGEFGPTYPQQLPEVSYGVTQVPEGDGWAIGVKGVYFTRPTPGAPNLGGTAVPGPIIESVEHRPVVPRDDEDLVVTARVRPAFRSTSGVVLRYRVMFAGEASLPMLDDGAHGDGSANDGVFGAVIPANLSTNGQMIRYAVVATDVVGNTSRWPLFTDPRGSEEYLGTVVDPTYVVSKLPVFHLFVAPNQMAGIDSESGGRLSFFYDGEFYDNVYMELRGNTSAGLPKKSHRLEFNRGRELRHAGPGGRTRRSSLLAEYLDPTYLRQHLCFWFLDRIGVPAPFDYPVRVQLNGQFYQLAFHTDVLGREQLERLGYDPSGALYKAVGNLTPNFSSTGGFQKLEPDDDPSRTDYLQLANGINESSPVATRRAAVFDLLDVPQVINHLSGARWCAENDDVWANMCLYRDTHGDGLWRVIPFDMNASWGQLYGGSNPLEATVDNSKSHPLYGGSSTEGNFNRLYDVIVQLPETRQMLLRRQRSILDRMVLPPGTPAESLILENYVRQMTNLIAAEAALDRARWGASPWAPGKSFVNGVSDLLGQFIGPRRRHWYVTHSITNTGRPIGINASSNAGIPLAQPPNAYLEIVGADVNPFSGNQDQEYLVLANRTPTAVDLSGWRLEGGIDFEFAPGTVVPSNGVVHVSPDLRAFRSRTSGPRGGQGLFVVGPYRGRLSARGESIALIDSFGRTVHTYGYAGEPSLAQQFLRVTEIQFRPAPIDGDPTPAEAFAYLELRNTATSLSLDLTGVRFVEEIEFDFGRGTITRLGPGARLLVAKNPAALAARHGAGLPIAGAFGGWLGTDGGRIRLVDARDEVIHDFEYRSDWQPLAERAGFSLVVVDDAAAPGAWGTPDQWRISGVVGGTPGWTNEPPPPTVPGVLVSEVLTRPGAAGVRDAVELHNPDSSPADIGGWWLTDDFDRPAKFRIPSGTSLAPGGYLVLDETAFGVGESGFALGATGDSVWLFSADDDGRPTGYVHGFRFGAAEEGVTFGRWVTGDGREHFVAQIRPSLGAANAGPRVGPVVVGEIHYHPADRLDGGDDDGEYVEILNDSATPVPLFDVDQPDNTWRIRGGIDFDFPNGVTLGPGEAVLVVAFDPADGGRTAAFRTRHSIDAGVRLFGPFSGRLDNAGQDVELRKPSTPTGGEVPYVLVDEVEYDDEAPWPAGADGYGLSLQRLNTALFGNDPNQWTAASPSPGRPTSRVPVAAKILVPPAGREVAVDASATLTVEAVGTPPVRYQWYFEGGIVPEATNATLVLPSIRPDQAGGYRVVVHNAGGSDVSSVARLVVTYPPTIVEQPRGAVVAPGADVSFGVTARSLFDLRYQWRRSGRDLPGATNATLNLREVQPSQAGDYTVRVADPTGAVVSAPARLEVLVAPAIVVQPVSQSLLPGGPLVLSLAVTNTATLPLGIVVRRTTSSAVPGPDAFHLVDDHQFFLTLSGADASPPWVRYTFVVTNRVKPEGVVSLPANLEYLVDEDSDGLPDSWEAERFGAAGAHPTEDTDGDGRDNRQEYLAGTDPKDASSVLRIDGWTPPPGATVRFLAVSNRTYAVEFADPVGVGSWTTLAEVVAAPTNRMVTITDPEFGTHRVYRLVTPRQP